MANKKSKQPSIKDDIYLPERFREASLALDLQSKVEEATAGKPLAEAVEIERQILVSGLFQMKAQLRLKMKDLSALTGIRTGTLYNWSCCRRLAEWTNTQKLIRVLYYGYLEVEVVHKPLEGIAWLDSLVAQPSSSNLPF
ncbi:MAG: hypothetical protein Q8O14_07305 [bacterium]|nr:hypothetical protein [bacterium]